jgi:hypothetical protein
VNPSNASRDTELKQFVVWCINSILSIDWLVVICSASIDECVCTIVL